MQTFDLLAYFSGMSAGLFFLASLICGLQLCFNIFGIRNTADNILSRLVGGIMLLMSCSTLCYILYDTFIPGSLPGIIGNTIDFIVFTVSTFVVYILYANILPSMRTIVTLSVPFLILAVINVCIPDFSEYLPDLATIILVIIYSYFGILLRHHEASLDDLYSNPDSHSLSWIRGLIALLAGWWILHSIFRIPAISIWCDPAMYTYMTALVLFTFSKVASHNSPLSLETRQQVEQVEWSKIDTASDISNPLQKELLRLLEQEQIFLDPDLTVEDVVKKLGTNTKYFSAMLHNDMHTTFCALINEYRVEKAKELLQSTDDKVEHIGLLCGFNSRQSFNRTFSRITGKVPTEFRKL